jgi:signal transduction histidine kinase
LVAAPLANKSGADSEQLLHSVLLEITSRLEADASQFVWYDPAEDLLVSYALTQGGRIVAHPDNFPTSIRATGSGCFEVLKAQREPRLFDPIAEPELFWPGTNDYHRSFGTRTIIVVPVHFAERFAGYVGLAFQQTYALSPEDQPVVEALARQCGIAAELVRLTEIERQISLARDAERAAREQAASSERRTRILGSVAAASRDLQEADDFEAGLVTWLRQVARAAGADAAGLGDYQPLLPEARMVPRIRASWTSRPTAGAMPLMHGIQEVPHTSDFEDWTARILRGETVWANLSDLKDPASRRYWEAEGCAGHVLVPVHQAGNVNGFMSFDFFAERQYESDLVIAIQTAAEGLGAAMRRHAIFQAQLTERDDYAARMSKSNAALQATVDAVSRLEKIDTFLPRVVGIVAEAFDAIGVGYFEHTDELIWHRFWLQDGKTLAAKELPDLDPQHMPTMELLARGFWVGPEHLGVDIRQRTRPSIVHHATATASPDLHAFCLSRGWHWELNVPLFVGGRTDAAIVLFHDEGQPFTDSDVELAESLAKQISLAREVGRLGEVERRAAVLMEREQASQARAALLERSNVALQQSVDLFSQIGSMAEAVPGVLRIVAAAFDASYCAYCEYADGRIHARHWYWDGKVLGPRQVPGLEPSHSAFIGCMAEGFAEQESRLASDALHRSHPYVLDHRVSSGAADVGRFRSRLGLDFELNIPLVVDGRTVGGLMIFRSAENRFNDDELALGASLGKQLALAMQVTQQAEREREITVARARAKELTRANEVLKQTLDVVASEADQKKVLGQVLRAITQQLKAESSALWLLDHRSNRFKVRLMWRNGQIVEVDAEGTPHPEGVAPRSRDLAFKRHIEERRPIVYDVSSFRDTDAEAFQYFTGLGLTALLGIPLLIGEGVVGSLTVRFDRQPNLADEDVALTQAMAHQATMAIQLTRLGEQASQAAVNEERARFARDVHDSLAQGFTGILMQLGAASQVSGADREQIAPHLAAIATLARSSLAEARRSVRELRRISVSEGRFEDRIGQLVDRMRLRTSAAIHLQIDGAASQIPVRAQTELLGIVQEAMVNAIQHSKCTMIQVSVECICPRVVRISIRDDGVGFDAQQPTRGDSFGILGMQERAEVIGGSLTIVSERNRGTEIVVQYRTMKRTD